ncbi:uncharacterized protein MYCFIDRAFT_170309 [Pseudocercospora fijiensis CIRAD86]|uniref:Uncharacterized protein n=1 Tax=Pseudocercospora fijiensis (strain CIRAD86) TaxID=383855 RepID=N1Q7M9_PSEFD|nr:uncharacterized protein MYCFIDRAFT_170309 [Pseudocercospora fijiensis CIRAD86]EME88725.1 hypothetical protein MYCFIDRAFT_170309 [Pseudocercospora fijiensis CIRAD86]
MCMKIPSGEESSSCVSNKNLDQLQLKKKLEGAVLWGPFRLSAAQNGPTAASDWWTRGTLTP